jgi:hypothetical protein
VNRKAEPPAIVAIERRVVQYEEHAEPRQAHGPVCGKLYLRCEVGPSGIVVGEDPLESQSSLHATPHRSRVRS